MWLMRFFHLRQVESLSLEPEFEVHFDEPVKENCAHLLVDVVLLSHVVRGRTVHALCIAKVSVYVLDICVGTREGSESVSAFVYAYMYLL